MRLSIIIPVLNQYKLLKETLNLLAASTTGIDTELILIDNNSDEGGQRLKDALNNIGIDWQAFRKFNNLTIFNNDKNTGNYPVFEQALKVALGDVLAYFHSDLFVYEQGWDSRVCAEFDKNEKLGIIGFIGSSEIDNSGGRGLGTMSNFQGRQVGDFKGSPASVHGAVIPDLRPAVVVDGCSMIFRRKCLIDIGFKPDFPLHHFYDRLMCCQALEKDWQVGVLGIQSDHISGQTANQEQRYHNSAKEWIQEHLGIKEAKNWDHELYKEAERQFLKEFRDEKHFIPVKVDSNWEVKHI